MNQDKTPISILQEMMQQRNIVPHYQLLSEHGSRTHKPTFVVRVNADGMIGMGKGSSKKTAKQEAARDFLHKMGLEKIIDFDQNNESNNTEIETTANSRVINEESTTAIYSFETSSTDLSIRKKAVAVLKYYTMQLNLPSPQYEEMSACGPPHLRVFTYKCTIGSYNKRASGRTKIEARDTSALLMYEALKKINFEIPKNDQKPLSNTNTDTEEPSVKTEADDDDVENTKHVIKTENHSSSNMNYGSHNNRSTDYFYIIKNYVLAKNITYEDLWKDNVEYDFQTLDNVLTMLGIKYNITFMKQDTTFIASLLIDIVPAFYIIEIGATVGEVTKSVAKNLLFVLKVVTK